MLRFDQSYFVVTFTGEAPCSRLIHGWDRVLAYLDYEINHDTEETFRDPENDIHNEDNWCCLGGVYRDADDERHVYDLGIGETDHLRIVRITELEAAKL